jgi:hypothetical protein
MLLSGDIAIQNPELIFEFFMGPDMYDVYLTMMVCVVIMYLMTETRNFWYNPR